ncbi:MAG TPA: hypothetical protein PLM79_18665 [Syntrophobacteraceae bacterium]|nr:hypothetical protein [Syntrophobacteraceae bacterium]
MFRKWSLVLGIALLTPWFVVTPPSVEAGLSGPVCFEVTIPDKGSFQVTGRATPVSGDYIVYHGKATIADENPYYLGGTGMPAGKYVILNLTGTQSHKDGWRDTGIMQIQLNTSTSPMKGTFYEVGTDYDLNSKTFGNHFSKGTLKRINCP